MTGPDRRYDHQVIRDLVHRHGDIDYDALIAEEEAGVHFALSSLRHALLCWRPFRKEASALEIGSGYGALSGLFLKTFREVTLLEEDPQKAAVLQERFPQAEMLGSLSEVQGRYDYIFLIDHDGLYEDAGRLLKFCREHLKEKGTLVTGFRSRNGLKYSCGALDERVREPFAAEKLLTLTQFHEAAKIFTNEQIYCPFPDFAFTQAVYRSDSPPQTSFADRVRVYDPFHSPLIRNENEEYERAIAEGTLLRQSDFYLVFLSDDPERCPIERVILSPDRGERSFLTVFEKDRVYKKALHPSGLTFLQKTEENAWALQKRGIAVVPQELSEGILRMPRITSPGTLEVIGKALSEGKEEIIFAVFDRFFQDIRRSSEPAAEADPERWPPREDYGLLLQEAFIDMIPYNAFLQGGTNLYYDQEFAWKDCPAGFVMYRAIRYTHLHFGRSFDGAASRLWARYELSEGLRKVYQEVDDRFVAENRRFDLYRRFNDWAYIGKERIEENRRRLQERDPLLEKVHAVQLQLLKYFDAFCRENGLRYLAIHGTLLGAVRHHGFIPWDDDLDLAMPREDFDRLLQIYPKGKGVPFLQYVGRDGKIFYGGYAKLRDEHSLGIERHNLPLTVHRGIAIDILPLDYCPETEEGFQALQKHIRTVQRCIYARSYDHTAAVLSDLKQTALIKYYFFGRLLPYRLLFYWLDRLFHSVKHSSRRSLLCCYYGEGENRNVYDDRDLQETEELPFEDMQIIVPKNYHEWLKARFGGNYLALPRVRQRKHTDLVFKVDDQKGDIWKK